MGRLHLKETPEERAQRERNRRTRRKKASRETAEHGVRRDTAQQSGGEPSGSGSVASDSMGTRKTRYWRERASEMVSPPPASFDGGFLYDDDEWQQPAPSSFKIDQVRAEMEAETERVFREKLFDAMQDDSYDQRLDSLEADLNDYAYVPRRWRRNTTTADTAPHPGADADADMADPNLMEEEEYAEWVRENMWRRTHKAEMEERDRKKAERKAARERERKAREETKRLERERDLERHARQELKRRQRCLEAWQIYETRWKAFNTKPPADHKDELLIDFQDIPWPVFSVSVTTPEDLSQESISDFLLYGIPGNDDGDGGMTTKLQKKERIREALLRWHPDKFEGKMGSRLNTMQKDTIMQGVGIVARCLNNLMMKSTSS